jgi:sialate O-acetylesterase
LSVPGWTHAAVKPAALFSDNAVLQQGQKVPVWGTADEGADVTVSFQGQSATAKAQNGRWQVTLDSLKSGGPYEMTIASGGQRLTLKNILVGEVWIASGQSNMQWPVNRSANAEKTIAESANPMLRLFSVPRESADEPRDSVNAAWVECNPQTVPDFSAVAYFFGRDLQSKLGVPVGMIHTSYGGTPAEAWTSRAALEANADLKSLLASPPAGTQAFQRPTGLYNAMIHPLIPYAIKGAIWYQGESNAGRAYQYKTLFPTMIRNWRQDWGQGDFPFLFVQLAPFHKKVSQPGDSQWAELREAQRLTLKQVPATAMAVITDVGDEDDIHPQKKEPVGQRLALAALALAYGKDVEYSGPAYAGMEVRGHEIWLRFDHVDGGLVAMGDALEGFTIAGADQKFHPATAEIRGDKVVVSSPEVSQPVAVRYGWADYPVVNLANRAGLLASPFATDDFPWITAPKPPEAAQGSR